MEFRECFKTRNILREAAPKKAKCKYTIDMKIVNKTSLPDFVSAGACIDAPASCARWGRSILMDCARPPAAMTTALI
jgi:hypothetical protein